MSPPLPLLIFARAPVPGHAKTRLAPALGEGGAAALAAAFLEDALLRALSIPVVRPVLVSDGPLADGRLRALLEAHRIPVRRQGEGDLGVRMAGALEEALRADPAALLVGTDAPTLPAAAITSAVRALVEHDLVFGPAADGGFYLVGARGRPPRWPGARWSSPHALADCLASNAERRVTRVTPWYDVDDPDDLRLLRAHLAEDPAVAPATRAALRRVAPG